MALERSGEGPAFSAFRGSAYWTDGQQELAASGQNMVFERSGDDLRSVQVFAPSAIPMPTREL